MRCINGVTSAVGTTTPGRNHPGAGAEVVKELCRTGGIGLACEREP